MVQKYEGWLVFGGPNFDGRVEGTTAVRDHEIEVEKQVQSNMTLLCAISTPLGSR